MKPWIKSRRWRLAVQVLVVCLLFVALLYIGGKDFLNAFTNLDQTQLALAFVAYFASLILTFFRWYLLVRALDLPFRIYDAIRLGFVGAIISLFMPGSVTGDLVKAGFIATEQKRRSAAVATIVVDRILGLYSLLLLTSVLGVIFWNEVQAYPMVSRIIIFVWATTGGAGVAVLMTIPFRAEPLIQKLGHLPALGPPFAELVRALQSYKHKPKVVLITLLIGMLGHVGFVLCFYFAALGSPGETPSWQMHFLLIPVYMVAGAIPMTPLGNMGVGELMLGKLYQMIGADFNKGAAIALVQRAITWLAALIGLIWYIPLKRAGKIQIPGDPETPTDLVSDGSAAAPGVADERTDHSPNGAAQPKASSPDPQAGEIVS